MTISVSKNMAALDHSVYGVSNIRGDAAWVAACADFVSINVEKIPAYTHFLLQNHELVRTVDTSCHLTSGDDETVARYHLALDSINFGSGYFFEARRYGIDLEYQTIAGGLKLAFQDRRMADVAGWTQITAKDIYAMISVPEPQNFLDSLFESYAKALRETGIFLQQKYHGSVMNLLEDAHYSAPDIAAIVSHIEGFLDVAPYKGRLVSFYKRAQIFAADIHLAFGDRIKNIEQLTSFADNMVPHVLRCDGVLSYASELAEKIDSRIFIDAGSAEEVELRGAAVHVVELIKEEAQRQGRDVTSANIDHIIWNRGYNAHEIYERPSHRTKTTFY